MPIAVGGIRIDRVPEMEAPFRTPAELFVEDTAEALDTHRHWLEPGALCPDTGRLILAVQSYLVRTGRHTVLIDTCVGCHKSNPWHAAWDQRTDRAWLARLSAAGVAPEAVDYVFCTHLHSDHCGWNTQLVDGRWVPTFPNATYILAKSEVDHIRAADVSQYHESVLPVIAAGQALLVDTDHALDDEIWLEPTPGHTPGHYAVGLASNGAEAVMCGDLIHSPIQCLYPHWRYRIDTDPVQGNATRRAFLEANCERDRLVMTAHFPSPSMGHVVADGDAFRFRFLS
jgi:glyoxylase-like metal-dependent hydrolase (beta-lactamase superfamily II)